MNKIILVLAIVTLLTLANVVNAQNPIQADLTKAKQCIVSQQSNIVILSTACGLNKLSIAINSLIIEGFELKASSGALNTPNTEYVYMTK